MSTDNVTTPNERPALTIPRWLTSLSTPAGLAILSLMSLVAGGVIQDIRNYRDLNRTWLQERSKHQLAVRKAFLDEQTAAVEQLSEAVSTIRETSMALLDLTRPEFDDQNLKDTNSRKTVEEQRQRVRKAFNAALDRWERTRYLSDYRLNVYSGDDAALHKSWVSTREVATVFSDCASESYLKVVTGKAEYAPHACADERRTLDRSWAELSRALRATRRLAWHDWESPPPLLR